jgi:hypothetical protein
MVGWQHHIIRIVFLGITDGIREKNREKTLQIFIAGVGIMVHIYANPFVFGTVTLQMQFYHPY